MAHSLVLVLVARCLRLVGGAHDDAVEDVGDEGGKDGQEGA